MENWIYTTTPVIFKVLISVICVYTVMVIITRISGLRTFAKMSSIDFASTIAIGSVLASTILNPDQSLLKGAVALGGIVGFQSLFSLLLRKSNAFKHIASNEPLLLMINGEILYDNLNSANLGEEDLMAKLREANALDFSEVKAVVLENTGDMSVLHGDKNKELHPDILMGVRDR